MRKAVTAVLHNSTNNPDCEKRHQFCPRRPDSWCKYQKDIITGEITYIQRTNIDPAVSKVIAPAFSHNDLGSEKLLAKWLHRETQNVNESINNIIWARCPKRVYVGNLTLKTAVTYAVISFNDGKDCYQFFRNLVLNQVSMQFKVAPRLILNALGKRTERQQMGQKQDVKL